MTEHVEITLSGDAVRLATHLVQISEKGLTDPIDWSTLLERFSANEKSAIAEAAFELEQVLLVSVAKGLNAPDGISHIRPDYALYWLLDHDVFGYDTDADTIVLLDLILEDDKNGSADVLRQVVDWPLRRFNPPFARIVEQFPDGRVSRPLQPDYPAKAVIVTAEDRVQLKTLRTELTARLATPNKESDTAKSADAYAALDVRAAADGRVSWFLSHPNWTGIGVLVAMVSLLLVFYPPSVWNDAKDRKPEPSRIQAARTALRELAPSKQRIEDVLRHFDFGVSARTSNEQARAMMLFLQPNTVLPTSRGEGATTGTFGTPDSNGLQYEVTIWKSSYERANVYGIRFGLSDSSYWGCNDSYMEIVKRNDSNPLFVQRPGYDAPCQ